MTIRELLQQDREEHAEREKVAQQEYESKEQALTWGLKWFLNSLSYFAKSAGEGLNELLKLRGDMGALRQRTPGACVGIVELIARELKLSPQAVEAALGLPPPAHDALDTLLLDTVRGLAPEVRHGTLPLSRITAAVNADRTEHEALSPALLASRLRVLGFPFTRSHPTCLIWMPNLVFPTETAAAPAPLVPSPEEPCARENGSNIQ